MVVVIRMCFGEGLGMCVLIQTRQILDLRHESNFFNSLYDDNLWYLMFMPHSLSDLHQMSRSDESEI